MNISQAKLINLVDFLEQEGHKAVKQRGHIYWYNSPIRSESSPSFKVDSSRNEWYDYGLGEGGDILDLIKGLYNVKTTSEALTILAPKSNSFINAIYHRKDAPPKRQESGQMHNVAYHPLTHQALLSYMLKRKIDVNLSRVYCCEVHYDLRDKHYFGIAFRNRIGGYEIRNQYYKGCIGHKDITLIRKSNEEIQEHIIVFEGFMDFLSYMMLTDIKSSRICLPYQCDYMILNSINCLDKALSELPSYKYVHSYLDNDDGGKRTFQSMKDILGDIVIDETHRFNPYNDLNDYLVKQPNSEL
jgi:hypothetical protein